MKWHDRNYNVRSFNITNRNQFLIADLLAKIKTSTKPSDIGQMIANYDDEMGFQIVHLGMCRLDNTPLKDIIFSRELQNTKLSAGMFPDELKWAVCKEAEALMKPYDLLSHEFTSLDGSIFDEVIKIATMALIKEVIIIPMRIRNTLTISMVHFPDISFAEQSENVLSTSYQLTLAVFEQFPFLTKWPDDQRLTNREIQILEETAQGSKESDIASQLSISSHTVRNHMENIKRKLEARNKFHAVSIAIKDNEIHI